MEIGIQVACKRMETRVVELEDKIKPIQIQKVVSRLEKLDWLDFEKLMELCRDYR